MCELEGLLDSAFLVALHVEVGLAQGVSEGVELVVDVDGRVEMGGVGDECEGENGVLEDVPDVPVGGVGYDGFAEKGLVGDLKHAWGRFEGEGRGVLV